MIVFGSNHFKLRSYHPEELGIPFDPNGEKVMIDCIQKYGHLYWIPFIGTGKQWVVRNRKGEMYPLPQKFQKMIPADKRKVKTPFYTFAGPILIVLGICGFMVSEKMEKRQREQAAQERFDENKKLLNEQVADIKVDDYLIFSAKADPDEKNRYGKSYNGIPFKVVEMNNDALKVMPPDEDPFGKSYYNSNRPLAVLSVFKKGTNTTNSFWIQKNGLTNTIATDRKAKFLGVPLPGITSSVKFKLMHVFRLDGPIFKSGSRSSRSNNSTFRITNQGLPVYLDKIEIPEGAEDFGYTFDLTKMSRAAMSEKGRNYIDSGKSFAVKANMSSKQFKKGVKFNIVGRTDDGLPVVIQASSVGQRSQFKFTRIK